MQKKRLEIANKHMKGHSKSLVLMTMRIKIPLRNYYTLWE